MSGCHIYLRQSVGLNRESAEEAPTTERVITAVCHMDSSRNYTGGLKNDYNKSYNKYYAFITRHNYRCVLDDQHSQDM